MSLNDPTPEVHLAQPDSDFSARDKLINAFIERIAEMETGEYLSMIMLVHGLGGFSDRDVTDLLAGWAS